ncbi:MAG: hypothetical protein ACLUG9_16910 [Paraclostridium sordellii]
MSKINVKEVIQKLEELLIHDPISFGYVQALTDIKFENVKELQRKNNKIYKGQGQ